MAARAGATPVEVGLDVGFGERHARWAAIDHAADGRPVTFAEVGDTEEVAEGAGRHGPILAAPHS
jgi:hypothetical protein